MSKLSERMLKERETRKLTTRQVGDSIKRSPMMVVYIEQGVTTKGKTIDLLAEFYGISQTELHELKNV